MYRTIVPRARIFLLSLAAVCASVGSSAVAQQEADPAFRPDVDDPMHARGEGPLVLMDAAHHNFHAQNGLYAPFAAVLEADGYNVRSIEGAFTPASLGDADVLVIATAMNRANVGNRTLPTLPALGDAEIEAVVDFVASGSSLFLIVDQMPFPGATAALAARFGIDFANAAIGEPGNGRPLAFPPSLFTRSEGTVGSHSITRGRGPEEAIDRVASFSGTGFPVTGDAVSLIHFGENTVLLFPDEAREFDDGTAHATAPGWSQGVAIEHGDGRVVIFGEAAMFTSQLSGGDNPPRGLRYPGAEQNEQLLLNVVRWLSFDL